MQVHPKCIARLNAKEAIYQEALLDDTEKDGDLYIYTHNSLRTKKNTKFDLKKNI
jgi:hypothetical protein